MICCLFLPSLYEHITYTMRLNSCVQRHFWSTIIYTSHDLLLVSTVPLRTHYIHNATELRGLTCAESTVHAVALKIKFSYPQNERFFRHYSLTPRSTVLLEQLSGLQLAKKFHAFYKARRFITAFTSARHLSLSWASSIQSTKPHPTS